jgi:cytochrome b561
MDDAGERRLVRRHGPRHTCPQHQSESDLLYGLTAMAAFMVIAILVLRRLWGLPAESVLAAHREDRATTLRWQTGYLVTYALSEAIALYGVALHFIGFSFPRVILFCLAGFGLLLFFRPPMPGDGTTS